MVAHPLLELLDLLSRNRRSRRIASYWLVHSVRGRDALRIHTAIGLWEHEILLRPSVSGCAVTTDGRHVREGDDPYCLPRIRGAIN